MANTLGQPTPDEWLSGTPYLIGADAASSARFSEVYQRSLATRARAEAVAAEIKSQTQDILEPFGRALRTDLVAESNRLEGYEWSRAAVREVVNLHRELIQAPLHSFMEAMRRDPHLMEALGLYRAYVIADGWVHHDQRPREYEIRGLHAVVLAGTEHAGRYKWKLNRIEKSEHVPVDPFEVPRAMTELTRWWLSGSPDPVLDATVVHAWLTHIHPFEDGNGRLARLLANLALSRAGYPPLILRSTSDRGQYLTALAASDEADILPLYDLFASVVKRSAKAMGRAGYARDFIQGRLLQTPAQRYEGWQRLAYHLTNCLRTAVRERGWDAAFQGYPDEFGYDLLCGRSSEGNCWYMKLFESGMPPQWLLWFGYRSDETIDLIGTDHMTPSIFFSIRDDDPTAVHPFRALFDDSGVGIPTEMSLVPGEIRPVVVRRGYSSVELRIEEAAELVAQSIVNAARAD
ncbi:MAG: Fic family protein [Gaiellaceae bacterium]